MKCAESCDDEVRVHLRLQLPWTSVDLRERFAGDCDTTEGDSKRASANIVQVLAGTWN